MLGGILLATHKPIWWIGVILALATGSLTASAQFFDWSLPAVWGTAGLVLGMLDNIVSAFADGVTFGGGGSFSGGGGGAG